MGPPLWCLSNSLKEQSTNLKKELFSFQFTLSFEVMGLRKRIDKENCLDFDILGIPVL